jgi:hypothetical protein
MPDQQKQHLASCFAKTLQETVAGPLPSGTSIAITDQRVADIKVCGGEGEGRGGEAVADAGCTVFEIANADWLFVFF